MFVSSSNLDKLLTKFAQILGILYSTFKPNLVQKFSRIKVYNVPAPPILLYASEIWTLREKDKKRFTSIELKVLEQPGTNFLTTKGIKKVWKICK
jgi:hypothetical protein